MIWFYSTIGGVEGIAFFKTNISTDPEPVPDIELVITGVSACTDYGLFNRRLLSINREIYDVVWDPLVGKNAYQVKKIIAFVKG